MRGYSICTSPRSGSNFLCQHLSSTGVLGHPLEYFNGRGRRFLMIQPSLNASSAKSRKFSPWARRPIVLRPENLCAPA
ncbi:hypothetical protein FJ941_28635 [Mesorhizobium sp. B2-3-13]|nr:hypothetical protein FJ941_28635 [Mesorhizobium sp. B2-3-13]